MYHIKKDNRRARINRDRDKGLKNKSRISITKRTHTKVVAKKVVHSAHVPPQHRRAARPDASKRAAREMSLEVARMQIVKDAIKEVVSNKKFSEYVAQNIGKKGIDLIEMLSEARTDDDVAEKTGIKINEVRRMLNAFNTNGIVRYDANKTSSGWLTFKWYVDVEKLQTFVEELNKEKESRVLPDGCNDFFICEKCYSDNRTIFPFWTAQEMNFKCECGQMMKRLDKEEAARLMEESVEESL